MKIRSFEQTNCYVLKRSGLKTPCKRNVEEYPLFSGLSILQNGKMSRFMKPDVIESMFENSDCTPCITMLRKGLVGTGVYQVRL